MKKTRMSIVLSISILTLTFLWSSHLFANPKTGSAAPALEMTTFSGETFNLSQFKGKTVLIHFWATWCDACKKEMPLLIHFVEKNKPRVELILLSVDRTQDREDAKKMIQNFSPSFRPKITPLLIAGLAKDAKKNDFNTPGTLPLTYVISPSGNIQKIFSPGAGDGNTAEQFSEQILRKLLAE